MDKEFIMLRNVALILLVFCVALLFLLLHKTYASDNRGEVTPWSNILSTWPKRLPEGYKKTVSVGGITVVLCGKNHPVLDQRNYDGGVIQYNNFMWLKGYRRKDGKLTIKPKWRTAGHEFQHLLNHADSMIINPDLEG